MSALPAEPRRQWRLIAIVLTVVAAALFAAYYAFFRTPMAPAFQNIREADASAIVAQLGKAGIPYRLANDGHDVMVPADRAADARVAVAGANIALGGTVGFELFDDSDMGLTEFAQKINFQRAMQGELARTIIAMQGVEFARVHLALPERSIFRASQGAPTSAVTVKMTPGNSLTPERIAGIRQLVASSVPGLAQAAVAVLDENGDLVGPVAVAAMPGGAPADEASALGVYYQLKAKDAVRQAVAAMPFEVVVNVGHPMAMPIVRPTGDRSQPDRSDVTLTIVIRTETPLPGDGQERVVAALNETNWFRRDAGDTVRFTTGAVGTTTGAPFPATAAPRGVRTAVPIAFPPAAAGTGSTVDWRLAAGLAVAAAVAIALSRSRRRQLDEDETRSFAEQLKAYAPMRSVTDAA